MNIFLNKRYFKTIFLIVFLALFVIISGFSFSLYTSNVEYEEKQRQAQIEADMALLAQKIDDKFGEMENICIQLLDSSWVKQITSRSEIILAQVDYFRRKELCEFLNGYSVMLSVADNVALIMPEKNQIMDKVSIWDEIPRQLSNMDVDSAGFLAQLDTIYSSTYGGLTIIPGCGNHFVVTRVFDIFHGSKDAFLFFVDGRLFENFIRRNQFAGLLSFAIEHENQLLFEMSGGGSEIDHIREAVVPSQHYRWQYRISADYPVQSVMQRLPVFIAQVVILPTVCELALTYAIALLLYQPILWLMNRLNVKDASEFSAIAAYFDRMRESHQTLQELSSRYYDVARNNMLLSMLHGSFAGGISEENLSLFNIPLPRSERCLYMAAVLSFSEQRDIQEMTLESVQLQSFLNQSDIPAIVANSPENEIIVVFFERDDKKTLMAAHATATREYCQKSFPAHNYLLGLPHHMHEGISKSYQEAKEQELDARVGRISNYYFPLDWEIQLIQQIRMGRGQVVCRILSELKRENLDRCLTAQQNERIIRMIAELILRAAEDCGVQLETEYKHLLHPDACGCAEALWDELIALADALCFQIGGRIGTPEKAREKQIKEYVDMHFRDANLSQKQIADVFQMTSPGVSKLFKSAAGTNFIDYLHALRTRAAKEMFDSGETDIHLVSQSCGYDNDVTFRRAFFRAYALTPHQYTLTQSEHRDMSEEK